MRRARSPTSTSSCLLTVNLWKNACAQPLSKLYPKISSLTLPFMRYHKMKYHKLSLVVFLLIGVSSTSFFTATAGRNSPQELNRSRTRESQEPTRESQESERSLKRDEWQRPGEVMDALGTKPASRVADIGCGFGYFTFRLAARVGAEGKVYAVDIEREAINKVRERKEREKLAQVEPILGESADPH